MCFFLVDTNERKLRDFWIFAWPEIYLEDFLLKYRAACVWFVFWGSQAHLGFESRRSRFWQGSLNANHFGGIKHCKCMVWNLCPVWVGVILGAPVFWSPNQAQALRSEMEKKSDQLKHTNTLVKCFCQQRLGFFVWTEKGIRKLTGPIPTHVWVDDFPFPKVGYVTRYMKCTHCTYKIYSATLGK